jgi:hypothetical protein
MAFLFEGGIVSTSFKEVAQGLIEMPESWLERHRRNRMEPRRLCLLLEQYQALGCAFVGQTLTMLVVGIRTLAQRPILDRAATAKGLHQDALLFITRVEAILVGCLLFHALQHSIYAVKCPTVSPPLSPHKLGPSIPRLKHGGFYGPLYNIPQELHWQIKVDEE